jgi:hypothetical protein
VQRGALSSLFKQDAILQIDTSFTDSASPPKEVWERHEKGSAFYRSLRTDEFIRVVPDTRPVPMPS